MYIVEFLRSACSGDSETGFGQVADAAVGIVVLFGVSRMSHVLMVVVITVVLVESLGTYNANASLSSPADAVMTGTALVVRGRGGSRTTVMAVELLCSESCGSGFDDVSNRV